MGIHTAPITDEFHAILDELHITYEHPARKYHNIDHIRNMLTKLDESAQFAMQRDRILLAIWFHDAVYDAERTDNEVKSAKLWIRKMTPFLLEEPLQWGKMAILATIDHYPNPNSDIQLLLDLDLASLGETWEKFQENTEHIRQEYSHVSDDRFREGRKDFFAQLLKRPRLYGTEYWHNLLEERARENMEKAIKCLTE